MSSLTVCDEICTAILCGSYPVSISSPPRLISGLNYLSQYPLSDILLLLDGFKQSLCSVVSSTSLLTRGLFSCPSEDAKCHSSLKTDGIYKKGSGENREVGACWVGQYRAGGGERLLCVVRLLTRLDLHMWPFATLIWLLHLLSILCLFPISVCVCRYLVPVTSQFIIKWPSSSSSRNVASRSLFTTRMGHF